MQKRPVLVALRALGLGDLLVAVPALRALARAYPGHRRVLLAPAWLRRLVELLDEPWDVLDVEGKDGLDPDRVAPPRVGDVDVAVNLHGRGPHSHVLLRRLAPRRLIAFAHPDVPGTEGLPAWDAGGQREHERERWCRLLRDCGISADPDDLALPIPPVPAAVGGDDVTLLHVGAAGPSRRWPLERWAAVADGERRRGRRVYLTGGAGERPDALVVARWGGLPDHHVLAGRTGVADLAALVAAAGRLVCVDTGVAHLATAFGTPSVVLFGPVSPARWGPPPGRPWHVALWAGREGDPFAGRPDPGLLRIQPIDVLATLGRLPSARPSATQLSTAAR